MTVDELNQIIEAYQYNQTESYKRQICASFYTAYFYHKGNKGLKSSDLKDVLNKIDGNSGEMTDEEMFEVLKKMSADN